MKKNTSQILANSGLPVLLCVESGKTADVNMRPFTVTLANGEDQSIISNSLENESKSPIDGEAITPEEEVQVETASVSALSADFPVIAHCEHCNHDTLTTEELASQFDGLKLHCMNCGTQVKAEYLGDFQLASDDEENADIVEVLEESTDDEGDDEDTNEEDDAVVEEEGTEEDADESTDEDTNEEDDAVVEEEGTEEELDEDTSDDVDLSEAVEEVVETVPVVATIEDIAQDVRIVSANSDRLEVFLGESHIGRILISEASEGVQRIAGNSVALNRAFTMALLRDLPTVVANTAVTDDLSAYGFKLATVRIEGSDMVNRQVAAMQIETASNAQVTLNNEREGLLKTLKIAMAGLNKGILPGENLVNSLASALTRFGIKNATDEAIKIADSVSEPFIETAYEHALNLLEEGPEYTRGLSVTIASAQFKVETPTTDLTSITSSVSPSAFRQAPKKQPANAPRDVTASAPADRSAVYSNFFSRIGR